MERDDLDFDQRRLCPDGACIGVLDDRGVCKECGKTGDPLQDREIAADPPGPVSPIQAAAQEQFEVDDDDDRELCPDGACIGLIGSDGRCKECGRPRA